MAEAKVQLCVEASDAGGKSYGSLGSSTASVSKAQPSMTAQSYRVKIAPKGEVVTVIGADEELF